MSTGQGTTPAELGRRLASAHARAKSPGIVGSNSKILRSCGTGVTRRAGALSAASSAVSDSTCVRSSSLLWRRASTWACSWALALPGGARPPPDALAGEDARAFAPPPPEPGRGTVLGPGARPVYVVRPALDGHRLPLAGRWQVLDRRRWVRLPGHAAHAAASRLAARLNRVARGP